jgi:hypothetical protein
LGEREPVPDGVVARVGSDLGVLDEVAEQVPFNVRGIVANACETASQTVVGTTDAAIGQRRSEASEGGLPAVDVEKVERVLPAVRDLFCHKK